MEALAIGEGGWLAERVGAPCAAGHQSVGEQAWPPQPRSGSRLLGGPQWEQQGQASLQGQMAWWQSLNDAQTWCAGAPDPETRGGQKQLSHKYYDKSGPYFSFVSIKSWKLCGKAWWFQECALSPPPQSGTACSSRTKSARVQDWRRVARGPLRPLSRRPRVPAQLLPHRPPCLPEGCSPG